MDLNTVVEVRGAHELDRWRPGDAWLAGGTALFSQPHPHLTRLLDLNRMGWAPLRITEHSLEIASTCTVAELVRSAPELCRALVTWCCESFGSSFKIWNTATVGGNLCLAQPAGPLIALAIALDGWCTLLTDGDGRRRLRVIDFILGVGRTALTDGEFLRSITVPVEALSDPVAFRRCSLRRHGHPAALVIGRAGRRDGASTFTVTASTPRPIRLEFSELPNPQSLRRALDAAIPAEDYVRDVHGLPAWRRHMTLRLAEQVRHELEGGDRD